MKITALQEYGVRILLQLADDGGSIKPMRIRSIAQKEALSIDYVEKILSRMRKSGLVKSVRGLNGGYALVRDPEKITIGQVILALTEKPIDLGHLKRDLCGQFPGNRTACTHLRGCSIRQLWSLVMMQVFSNLNRISLSDLLGDEITVQGRLHNLALQPEPASHRPRAGKMELSV